MYYNRDCKNTIYRLMNAGQFEAARLLKGSMVNLSESGSQSHRNIGLFYLKHLVKCDRVGERRR